MITKTYKDNDGDERIHIRARHFYDNFNKPRHNNFRSLGYKKAQRKVSYTLYCKIIKRFLLIYFYEVFFIDKPLFFFLGGKLIRCRISNFFTDRGVLINKTISVVWYLRPEKSMVSKFRIDLQKGSSNIIPKLRREFCESNDVGLLSLKKDLHQKFMEQKILSRQ